MWPNWRITILQVFLIPCVITQINRLACRKTAAFELRHNDKKVANGLISSKKVPSLIACVSSCVAVTICDSVNFKYKGTSSGLYYCELVSTSSSELIENKSGWNHYKPMPEIAYSCKINSCPPGYSCEETCGNKQGIECKYINQCLTSPCQNGATCNDNGYGFVCTCKRGFEGKHCERVQTCTSGCMVPVCNNLGNGVKFTTEGRTGRIGNVLDYTIPSSGNYLIKVAGAKGGTHSTTEGTFNGTFCGGNGATMEGVFLLTVGTVLKIVVGHRGGNSVEISGGQATTATAKSLGKSIEDNAGTGGGGGSFVYTSTDVLLIAAGGGGGGTAGWNGVDGSSSTNGTDSVGNKQNEKGKGGSSGQPGQCCNSGSYHGGTGAGWLGQGATRAGIEHGERGGSKAQNWVGGNAGKMNSGNNGGPPPGAVGGFGGGGGGSEDNGAAGAGGGYSGGGAGTHANQAGGGGGSFCNAALGSTCTGSSGGNSNHYGFVTILQVP